MAIAKSRSIMGKDQLERFIHDRLNDHQVKIDTEEIWPGIESALQARKDHPMLWWMGGAVVFLLVGIFLYSSYTGPATMDSSAINQTTLSRSPVLPVDSDHHTRSMSKDQAREKKGTSEWSNIGTPEQGGTVRATTPLTDEMKTGHAKEDHAINGSTIPMSVASKEVRMKNLSQPKYSDHGDHTSSQNFSFLREPHDQNRNTLAFNSSNTQKSTVTNEEIGYTAASKRVLFSPLLPIEDRVPNLSSKGSNTVSLSAPSLSDCYNFSHVKWGWSMDVYGGMGLTQKQLSEKGSNEETADYISAREDSESPLESFEMGAAVNFMHRTGFLASLGFNYARINEKFQFTEVEFSTRFDSVVVRVNVDSLGVPDSIKAWLPITTETKKELTTYNHYTTLDIPFSLGYQMYRGNWIFELEAGAMVNVLFQKKGELLSPDFSVGKIGDGTFFKDRIGLSLFGGIKVLYPLSRRVALYAEPAARIPLKSITVNEYILNQKYNRYNLRIGARITL